MPRKKLARRFDPKCGVSEHMLETECQYVGHEFRNYLVCSINKLRERLQERQAKIITSEANIQFRLSKLPDHERLAIRCMMARDFFHIAALYEKFLNSSVITEATGACEARPEELTKDDEPTAVVPFSGWLFDPKPAPA